MMEWLLAILTSVLMLGGALFSLIAAIGVLRFPDLFTRMHAASKAGTVGSGLILVALAVHSGQSAVWVKVLATLGFFVLTSPLSAHLLAKAARRAGAFVRNL